MRIQHNIPAINTHRVMGINNDNIAKSLEKLSSGYRINRAGDDAAGLAISEKMRAQIRGLQMASKNSMDAISLVQTAEGALQSTHDILQRMRELAVQSSSDTNETSVDRRALDQEFQQLIKEIDDTANKTRFNDQNLIDGTFAKTKYVITANGLSSGTVRLGDALAGTHYLTIKAITVGVIEGAKPTVIGYDKGTSIALSTGISMSYGVALQNCTSEFNSTYTLRMTNNTDPYNVTFELRGLNGRVFEGSANMSQTTSLVSGRSMITIDFAGLGVLTITMIGTINSESAKNLDTIQLTIGKGITENEGEIRYYAELGPDRVRLENGMDKLMFANSGVYIKLDDAIANAGKAVDAKASNIAALQSAILGSTGDTASVTISIQAINQNGIVIQSGPNKGDETTINISNMDSVTLGIIATNLRTQLSASDAIKVVNNALNKVSSLRADLGAMQNRLEFKIANLDNSAENLQAAEGRIRDTDMALEMIKLTKSSILAQAATAMLAQANALPQNVLQLLR